MANNSGNEVAREEARRERIRAHAAIIVGRYIRERCNFAEPSAQRDTFHAMPAQGRSNMVELAIVLATEIDDAVTERLA